MLCFFFFFLMLLRPPRSTLFPTRRSSDLRISGARYFSGSVPIARCTALRRSASTSSESCNGRPSGGFSSCGSLPRSEEHTSELQSQSNLVCRLLLEKKKKKKNNDKIKYKK